MKITWRFKSWTFYAVICAICCGLLLIGLNVYQLWNLPWIYSSSYSYTTPLRSPVAWICAKRAYHLKHVTDVFRQAGYKVIQSATVPYDWHVMWSFDFPFNKEYLPHIRTLKKYQKVNHIPGTGFFTLKVELATSKLTWIPLAFSMPREKKELINEAKKHPRKLWVQKSNNHRGIRIVDLKELDLSAEETFVQHYIANPILVDGRKFDIGVYTVVTSVNPLRVYIYTNEFLLRFCLQDYNPFDAKVVEKYVIGEDYMPPSMVPSLKPYLVHGHLSRKEALFAYLRKKGKNTTKLWEDIQQSVAELFIAKERSISAMYENYPSKHNFFELVRVDFILDEYMNLWLMEVNMSPNLSSASHPENGLMYEQVFYHALSLVGLASPMLINPRPEVHNILVNDADIMRNSELCMKAECLLKCVSKCALCSHCLSDENRQDIFHAYLEHIRRGNYRRVLPPSQIMQHTKSFPPYAEVTRANNDVMVSWFRSMCQEDQSWCS